MNYFIDAMGGDNAPAAIVEASIEAVKEYNISLTLVGKKELIEQELLKFGFDDSRITILNADSTISFDEEPVYAIRHKKDSSIVVGLKAVKENENAVFVSAGSTGALLAGAIYILGRIPKVKRPGLGSFLPQQDKKVFIIDIGASSDAKPNYILTYAILAKAYLECVEGYQNPSIGLVNIGEEPEKGSKIVKESYELLNKSGLNFKGNVEPSKIFTTPVDVLVTDGFTGNTIIKTIEGMASFVFAQIKRILLSSFKGKIGALLIKDSLSELKDSFDPNIIGGCPLLGVKGGVIKAHGSSNALAFKNAIHQAIRFSENHTVEKISEAISQFGDNNAEF